jgi:peptide/nickel transport system substrate-binding protein
VQELTKKRVVLVRNPYFAQWSYAAQPAGNPDTIVWVAAKAADGIGRVEHGSADALLDATPAQLAQVALRHPAQIYRHHVYGTHFVELNTRVAPFDSLLARQAVAYAVDRRALGVLFSGSRLTACQLLPPGFPGRTGTCRYTARGQEDGEWPRPDLRRARALVDESGTAGARVDVSVWQDFPGGLPVARALQTTLRALGYRARLRLVPAGRGYWTWEGDARAPVQAGVYGWAVDYPAAGNFYDHITHCPRLALATDSEDLTGLCDPVTERLAQQARAAEATDRGSATAIWRQVYQRVEDSAAVIPTDYWDDPAFLGTRVGNVQTSSYWGPLLEQMWVR